MKRNPRKVRWTKAFRKAAGKEMTIDSTFEFEKRRNVPVRYDRDLMSTTIKAIQRVQEIKAKRERLFTKNRLQPKQEAERGLAMEQLQKNVSLVSAQVTKKKQTVKVSKLEASKKMEIDE